MKKILAVLGLVALAVTLTFFVPKPDAAIAELRVSVEPMAGDSVRFVARFDIPVTTPPLDSVAVRWSLSGNNNQFRQFVAPFPLTVQDTAIFAALPTPGGGTAGGDIIVTTWRGGANTAVVKGYSVTLPDQGPPPGVLNLQLVDSAVVFN